jgi:D-alanyl-D-alanine dipeptidase
VVLINGSTNETLDMGTCYDYMDTKSHINTDGGVIGEQAWQYRQILSSAMQQYGFHTYAEEFWHFSHGGDEGREVTEPLDIPIRA